MSYLNQDEQVIWESAPAVDTSRRLGCISSLIVNYSIPVAIGILAIAGIVMLISRNFWGLLLLLLAVLVYLFRRRIKNPKNPFKYLYYILTNQRAIVLDVSDKNGAVVISECSLNNVVAISQNKSNISQTGVVTSNNSPQRSIANVIGDIVFLEGSNLRAKFEFVVDPDGVVKTVEEIKKSTYKA